MNIKFEEQLKDIFGFTHIMCEDLHMPTNDVFAVTTPMGKFALKLYNAQSRTVPDVEWEMELTLHFIQNGAPVAKPVSGKQGYVNTFSIHGQERAAVLFEWAAGAKPQAQNDTYMLLGKAAALIHNAADSFTSSLSREQYGASELIDEQFKRMQKHLFAANRWQQVVDLGTRLKKLIINPALDYGVCHMDLTLDNIHRDGDSLLVFDFDSAGKCWRALEPNKVLRSSREYFNAWLEGYRSIRSFDNANEQAVEAFVIINDIRNIVWKLGEAKSSRGKPLLKTSDLSEIVDGWLEWESSHIKY